MKNSIINDKLIYQFGNALEANYVFFKGKFEKKVNIGIKTAFYDSVYMDGDADLLLSSRGNKTAYELECIFYNSFISPYELNFISRVFYGGKKATFFYDYEYDNTKDINVTRPFGKVYYNYSRCIVPLSQTETQRENMEKVDLESELTLKMNKPYFYDCSEAVEYIDYTAYINSLAYWDTNTFDWDSNNPGWDASAGTFGFISDLTNDQKLQFFTDLKGGTLNYFMYIRDRFFARDTTQTKRKYILEATQNSGTNTDYTTNNVLLNASADTDIYRVELSQMATNQSLQILNLSNDSGLTIEWLDSVSSNATLVYNSYTKKLYETSLETEIPLNKYRVLINGNKPLTFSGLLNTYRIGTPPFEQIRLINSSGTILDVKIDVLPAYD